MKKIILLGLMFSAILASCSKNSVDQPTNPNPPSASQQDSAKYILIATRDQTLTTTLSCYNADKTLRWKKDSLGNAGHPGVLFGNGHIYYLVGYWDFTLGSSYNNFYSIEPSTGKIVWSILKSREHIVGLTLRNDTLFWAVQSNNSNYLAAYNANNGNLIWKSVLPAQGGPENLKIDGNMIYYFSAPLDISTNYINAFDITTKTVKWQHNVGPSIGNYPGIIAILGNILCFKNGTGALYAFDKNTGTVVWTKPGPDYNTPMVGNGVFYSMGPGYKLYEINSTNGNVISEIATGLYFTESQPFLSDSSVYISGSQATAPYSFVASRNVSTSALNWKTFPGAYLQYPVVSGQTLYMLKQAPMNIHLTTSYIMMLDRITGKVKDSIFVPGTEFSGVQIITASGKLLQQN